MTKQKAIQVEEIVSQEERYRLSIILYDDLFEKVLSCVACEIEGPDGERFSSATDARGRLHHDNVGPGYYKVIIGENFAYVPSVNDDSVYQQRIQDYNLEEESQDRSGEAVSTNED